MISIVGTRIYIHEKDTVSFRVVYRSSDNKLMNFSPVDNLVITVYNRESRDILLQREAENVNYLDDTAKVFTFNYEDSSILTHGDYKYSIVLVTREGTRYTLIDDAILNILEDTSQYNYIDPAEDDVEILTPNIHICITALVCKFNYTETSNIDGSLILF